MEQQRGNPGLTHDSADAVVSTRPRSMIWGIIITVLLFVCAIALLSWLMIQAGPENSYYNNLMDKGRARQEHAVPR